MKKRLGLVLSMLLVLTMLGGAVLPPGKAFAEGLGGGADPQEQQDLSGGASAISGEGETGEEGAVPDGSGSPGDGGLLPGDGDGVPGDESFVPGDGNGSPGDEGFVPGDGDGSTGDESFVPGDGDGATGEEGLLPENPEKAPVVALEEPPEENGEDEDEDEGEDWIQPDTPVNAGDIKAFNAIIDANGILSDTGKKLPKAATNITYGALPAKWTETFVTDWKYDAGKNECRLVGLNLNARFSVKAKLNLKGLDKLEYLDIGDSEGKVASWDRTGVNLTTLLASNIGWTKFDLHGMDKLTELDISLNKVKELNLNGIPALKVLNLFSTGYDPYGTGYDIFELPDPVYASLERLDITSNGANSLPLEQMPNLVELRCGVNEFTDLDLSSMAKLKVLDCSSNWSLSSLTHLDGAPNLEALYCGNTGLYDIVDTIYAEGLNLKLKELSVAGLDLESFDTSALPLLEVLDCEYNMLETLDTKQLPYLKSLFCTGNNLSSLDLSGMENLEVLFCNVNRLADLNVAGCENLWAFLCSINKLKSLDLRGCDSLLYFDCSENDMTSKNKVIGVETLPSFEGWKNYQSWGWFVFDPQNRVPLPGGININVTPVHAILAGDNAVAEFSAAVSADTPDFGLLRWSVAGLAEDKAAPGTWLDITKPGQPGEPVVKLEASNEKVTVTALDISKPRTLKLRAEYDGQIAATATIEILSKIELPKTGDFKTSIKILESKVTVNKAKEIGAAVPLLITQRKLKNYGIGTFSSAAPAPNQGTPVISGVRFYKKGKSGKWDVPLDDWFEAYPDPDNVGMLIIKADYSKAKTVKNIKARFMPMGGSEWNTEAVESTNAFDLNVVETWPKVAFKAKDLNINYPAETAPLTWTSPGGELTVNNIEFADNAIIWNGGANTLELNGPASPCAMQAALVDVSVAGYLPLPVAKRPALSVKVVASFPKVKLDKDTVRLVKGGPKDVSLRLASAETGRGFNDGYKVLAVEAVEPAKAGDSYVDVKGYDPATGVVEINDDPAKTKTGPAKLRVFFEDPADPGVKKEDRHSDILLNVVIVAADKITATAKPNKLSVYVLQESKNIATVPFVLNVDNLSLDKDDIKIKSITNNYNPSSGIKMTDRVNIELLSGSVRISFKNDYELNDRVGLLGINFWYYVDRNYIINIGTKPAAPVQLSKTFPIRLTITCQDPYFTVEFGKPGLDVTNPDNMRMTANVTFENTVGNISTVGIVDPAGCFSIPDGSVVGNSFDIVAKPRSLAPDASYWVFMQIELDSGIYIAQDVAVKPIQGKAKASAPPKTASLYKGAPNRAEKLSLGLASAADPPNPNMKLGVVTIDPKSNNVFKGGKGFEIVQSGTGSWELGFKGGVLPVPKKGKLKASYTVKLRLWPEGTFRYDNNGKPVPLKEGKHAAKPVTVNVKVKIK